VHSMPDSPLYSARSREVSFQIKKPGQPGLFYEQSDYTEALKWLAADSRAAILLGPGVNHALLCRLL
jgi:hypothetical protein